MKSFYNCPKRGDGLVILLCLSIGLLSPLHMNLSRAYYFSGYPGDSVSPWLVAIDAQNAHLLFTHFYLHSPDAIGFTTLQRSLHDGSWKNVIQAPILVSEGQVVRLPVLSSSDFSLIYLHYGATPSIRMQRYETGTWNPAVTLFTEEELQNYECGGPGPITNLQAVIDSTNHIHLVWERYFDIDVLENGTLVTAKRGVFYSEYDGEIASPPERVVELEYGTTAVEAPYVDPCGPDFEPCVRSFLTIDPKDHLHLAWFNGATYFTTRTVEGWTDPIRVDTAPYPNNLTVHMEPPYLYQADLPLLEFHVDSTGVLYFFYSVAAEHDRLLIIKYQDGNFAPIESDVPARRKMMDVEHDSTDQFHLAYIGLDTTGTPGLFYQTFKERFSAPVLISEFAESEVDLSIDADNIPHIVWGQRVEYAEIFYTQLTENRWKTPIQVTNGTEIDRQFGWHPPESSSTNSPPPLPEEVLSPAIFIGILTVSVILATNRRYKSKKRDNS